jgi:cell shape-determining protein MreD
MTVVSTLLFLVVIWMGIGSLVDSDRVEIAGSLPGALLMGWVWFLIRRKRLTPLRTLLMLCGLFVCCGILGAAQYVVISRTQTFTNSDGYDFLAGLILPGLIAIAVWSFLKRARNTPTTDQTTAPGSGSESIPPENG